MADMARADLEAMQRMAAGQARRARERVVAARDRYLALRDDVVPRAEQAIAPTLSAYSTGQVPLVSVVEAAQALWSAQRDLVIAGAEIRLGHVGTPAVGLQLDRKFGSLAEARLPG